MNSVAAYKAVKATTSVAPQSTSGGSAINGSTVDGNGFRGAQLVVSVGAASGSPTGISVAGKLQSSPKGAGTWTDVTGGAIDAIVSASSEARVAVSILDVGTDLRAVAQVTFTGGTSPAIPISATIVLTGPDVAPVTL